MTITTTWITPPSGADAKNQTGDHPLGVGSHLRYWGMNPDIIEEADWQQKITVSGNLDVYVLPARHFPGAV
jgi:L-ascorbate metabolism protein UlaG (beta-lactamase superfamily)